MHARRSCLLVCCSLCLCACLIAYRMNARSPTKMHACLLTTKHTFEFKHDRSVMDGTSECPSLPNPTGNNYINTQHLVYIVYTAYNALGSGSGQRRNLDVMIHSYDGVRLCLVLERMQARSSLMSVRPLLALLLFMPHRISVRMLLALIVCMPHRISNQCSFNNECMHAF